MEWSSISYFFVFLVVLSVAWLVGFKYVLTRRIISDFLRELGVGLKKTNRAFLEMRRKSFHLMGLLIPIIYYVGIKTHLLTQTGAAYLMGSLATFLWIVEIGRKVSEPFRAAYNQTFGSMLRQSELVTPRFTGTGFYFLGSSICIIFFHPIIAISAILFLVLGDLSAALIGISFGKIKIGKKSLEGTIAMFVTCYLIATVMFWHVHLHEYIAMVGALSACLVELLAPSILDDNLTIPVMSALALQLAVWRTQPSGALALP